MTDTVDPSTPPDDADRPGGHPAPWYAGFLPRTTAQVVVGVLALMFLGGAFGYLVGNRTATDDPPSRGSADVGFLYDMTTHHNQAIQLASIELVNGEDPDALLWAREILRSQSYEIGLMQMRLAMWGHEPADRPDTAMEWMGMVTSPEAMPGMASGEELDALRDAEGTEVDALFYALMIDHHAGGVAMAQHAADHAGDPWVRQTAATMAAIQTGEITEMTHTRDDADLPSHPDGFDPAFAEDAGHGAATEHDGGG